MAAVEGDSPLSLAEEGHYEQHGQPSSAQAPPMTLVDLLRSSSSAAAHTDFSSPGASSYLDQLLSLSLHELLRQPALISAEASTVESDLTNLCFREYPTFISVHKCSSAVKSAFDDFSGSLGKLIGAIPSLEDECRSFSTTTGGIQRVRGKAALVLEHQDKLYDLLEIPQLMETCVRNGYYQEAMELLNHCHSLAERYPLVALVQDVAKEVEGILQLMMAQLLALLREPVKLPALVKTVSFLRRLNAMEESELGLVFISSRYYNFRTQLLSIERDKAEPVRYLRRYIDLFREHVYDIIAQFTAIFLESSPSDIAAIHITSFANQAITDLVNLVEAYVPRIANDSASMSSILVQLGYCAMSFSRVGLDFAPLIAAPFTSTVLSTFSQSLASSSTEFSSILRDSAKAVLPPSQILVVPEYIPHIVSSITSPPPLPQVDSVSYFPPLASLFNAHITAFNNLRLLAPLSLHTQLISLHSASLLASSSVLLQYVTQATTFTDMPTGKTTNRPGHNRTPSAPRADLLRRNSEVQMTPEARAAKRREAKRVCVASVDVWCRMVVPFLVDKLNEGVFAEVAKPPLSTELQSKLDELLRWVKENEEGEIVTSVKEAPAVNGRPITPPPPPSPPLEPVSTTQVTNSPPRTPSPTPRSQTISSPMAFGSPFRASTTSQPDSTPHSNGIDAVFESPRASASASSSRLRSSSNGPHQNASTIPEPANLRDSEQETVDTMEAQLEAMNIGLTGEEAAVAVEIKHGSPQHLHFPLHANHEPRQADETPKALEENGEIGEGHQEEAGSAIVGQDVKIHQPQRLLDAVEDSSASLLEQPDSVEANVATNGPEDLVSNLADGAPLQVPEATPVTAEPSDNSTVENGEAEQEVITVVPVVTASNVGRGELTEVQQGSASPTSGVKPVSDIPEGSVDVQDEVEHVNEIQEKEDRLDQSTVQPVDMSNTAEEAASPEAVVADYPTPSIAKELLEPTGSSLSREVGLGPMGNSSIAETESVAKQDTNPVESVSVAQEEEPDATPTEAGTQTESRPFTGTEAMETEVPARGADGDSRPDNSTVNATTATEIDGTASANSAVSVTATADVPIPTTDVAAAAGAPPIHASSADTSTALAHSGAAIPAAVDVARDANENGDREVEADLDSPPPTASTEPSRPPTPTPGNGGEKSPNTNASQGGGAGNNKKKKKKKKGKS
ncbi:hypothetical protein IAU59_001423 [Kwoniella sp. CBS 9459]